MKNMRQLNLQRIHSSLQEASREIDEAGSSGTVGFEPNQFFGDRNDALENHVNSSHADNQVVGANPIDSNRNDDENHLSVMMDNLTDSCDNESEDVVIHSGMNRMNSNRGQMGEDSLESASPISSDYNSTSSGNRSVLNHSKLFRTNRKNYDCLVIWSSTVNKTEKFWDMLNEILCENQIQKVLKVVRCRKYLNRDVSKHKFEVYILKGKGDQIHEILKRRSPRNYGLFIKKWLPFHWRNNSRRKKNRVSNHINDGEETERHLVIVSWNVNSLVSSERKSLFRHSMNEMKPDIVFVQETRLKIGSQPLKVEGYDCIDVSSSGTGRRGLAILASKTMNTFSWYPVGQASENAMAIRVVKNSDVKNGLKHGLILLNIYVPAGRREAKKTALSKIGESIQKLNDQFSQDSIVVGGDFNLKREEFERLILYWEVNLLGSRVPIGETLKESDHNKNTWHQVRDGRLRLSELDYFLVIQPSILCKIEYNYVEVKRKFDMSDHWPIQLEINQEIVQRANNASQSQVEIFNEDDNNELNIGKIVPDDPNDLRNLIVKVSSIKQDILNSMNQYRMLTELSLSNRVQVNNVIANHQRNSLQNNTVDSKFMFDRRECLKKADLIKKNRIWMNICNENSDDINLITNKFIKNCALMAKKYKLVRDANKAKSFTNIRISSQLRRAIIKRQQFYKEFIKSVINYQHENSSSENNSTTLNSNEIDELKSVMEEKRVAYEVMKGVTKQIARQESKDRHVKWIEKSIEFMADNDSREYWRWLKTFVPLINRNRKQSVIKMPVKHPDTGLLVNNSKEIVLANALHYGRLACDITGHSKDRAYWNGLFGEALEMSRIAQAKKRLKKFGIPKIKRRERKSALDELGADISQSECLAAIKALKNNKATGVDNIPAEFLKACLSEDEEPTSPFANAIFLLIKKAFICDSLPEAWTFATIVSIPKPHTDDPLKLTNQRGISLMSVVLKILTKIIAKRLLHYCETCRLLIPEQAGFRTKEEAVAQATALVEICQRRIVTDKTTWLTFIDLKKAYDTVPHEALFHKLKQRFFIPNNHSMMKFLKVLYDNSAINFDDKDNGKRYSVALDRGLRQGCPISPILFNMFINDIADESTKWAVHVPQISNLKKVGVLLFADDLVLMARSRDGMKRAVRSVEQWCNRNEMKVGIKKCGSMIINDRHQHYPTSSFHINGEVIPKVNHYIYLGVKITNDIDLQAMFEFRLQKFTQRYGAISKQLSNNTIPLRSRILIVKSMLLPSLLYGAEIFGMSSERVNKAESVMKKICKRLLGLKPYSRVLNYEAALMELTLLPVHVEASARRVRLFLKPLFKTWLEFLKSNIFVSRKWIWTNGTRNWINRTAPIFITNGAVSVNDNKRLWFSQWCLKKAASIPRTRTLSIYIACANQDTAKEWLHYQSKEIEMATTFAFGFSLLLRARTRTLGTTRQWAQWRILPERYLKQCVMCGLSGNTGYGECLTHLLCECTAFVNVRRIVLGDLLEIIRKVLYDNDGNAKLADYSVDDFPASAKSSRIHEGLPDNINLTRTWSASSLRRARILLLGGELPELGRVMRGQKIFNDRFVVTRQVSKYFAVIWSGRQAKLQLLRQTSQQVESQDRAPSDSSSDELSE